MELLTHVYSKCNLAFTSNFKSTLVVGKDFMIILQCFLLSQDKDIMVSEHSPLNDKWQPQPMPLFRLA